MTIRTNSRMDCLSSNYELATSIQGGPSSVRLQALKSQFRRQASWQQREVDHYGGVDFDGLAVQQRGGITPAAHGFDGGSRQVGIDGAIEDLKRQGLAVHPDDG